jgi:predicted GNAT superfamily acetyltransferase
LASGEIDPIVVQVAVPHEVADWKRDAEQRKLAESLQTRNRHTLETAFARGLAITGYERNSEGDGCFLLGPTIVIE